MAEDAGINKAFIRNKSLPNERNTSANKSIVQNKTTSTNDIQKPPRRNRMNLKLSKKNFDKITVA